MVVWRVIDWARQSGWVKAAAALCVLAICIGSLLPETERVPTGLPDGKLEHFLAYSVTGLLLGLAMSGRNAPILAALNLALLACLLEFLQQWSPGRHPRVSDAVVGALAGILGASISACLSQRRRNASCCAPRTRLQMSGGKVPSHSKRWAVRLEEMGRSCRASQKRRLVPS